MVDPSERGGQFDPLLTGCCIIARWESCAGAGIIIFTFEYLVLGNHEKLHYVCFSVEVTAAEVKLTPIPHP